MNIFVGNLSFSSTEDDVKKLFEGLGSVASVVIVMSKEKKAPKSRGFGFLEMPDQQQALAAIGALNGKEFMGRVLNVSPARPKTEAEREKSLKKKREPRAKIENRPHPQEETGHRESWFSPVFNRHDSRVSPSGRHVALNERRVRPSGQYRAYGSGRRTRSYVKRTGLSVILPEGRERQKNQDNPMRWRKKRAPGAPWQKGPGGYKPWEKAKEGPGTQKRSGGESRAWRKPEDGSAPWKKNRGERKFGNRSSSRPQEYGFKGRKKSGGYKRHKDHQS